MPHTQREEHIEKIRKACIEANPEIMELNFGCELEEFEILGRPIKLSDVLLAIKETYGNTMGFFLNQYGMFYHMLEEIKYPDSMNPVVLKYKELGWNLREDDLTKQSPECLQFLADLLSEK